MRIYSFCMNKILCFFILLLCVSCHHTETDGIIPGIDKEEYPEVQIYVHSEKVAQLDDPFALLGCGYDCTFENFKGTSYLRSKVLDIGTSVLKDNINEALLYDGGYTYSIWGNNLEEYKKKLYQSNNVSSEIHKERLDLFIGDVKRHFDFPEDHSYYCRDFLKPTHRLTLAETDVEFLKDFLSENFLYDLIRMNADAIITKYGTHVITDVLLGGAFTVICNSEPAVNSTHLDFEREASYFCYTALGSISETHPREIFRNSQKVDLYIKIIGGETEKMYLNSNGIIDFGKWVKSVNKGTEQIIGIGNNTTRIYLLSEFVDDAVKKEALECAIERYCNRYKEAEEKNSSYY